MCFGSGDDSASQEMIQMQKDEAARIAQEEADRQARITGGLATIENMFHGAPVMQTVTQTAQASGTGKPGEAVPGLPAGYTYVNVPDQSSGAGYVGIGGVTNPYSSTSTSTLRGGGTSGHDSPGSSTSGTDRSNESPTGGGHHPSSSNQTTYSTTPTKLAIQGPDGTIYDIGADIGYSTEVDTGETTGDWQEQFLNEYKQEILNYYGGQITDQLGDAKDETTYRLARAGTLTSDAGIMAAADLEKQKLEREGEVALKAENAATDLQKRIDAEQTAAENQLYATENPEVAANQATAAIQNITAEAPDLSPLAEIFEIAAIGGANVYKGADNAARLAGGYGSGSSSGRNQTYTI